MLKETDCFQHIYIRTGYTDLRLGIDGLAAVIREDLGRNPFEENTLYLFCGRRTDRIKGLSMRATGSFFSTRGSRSDISSGRAMRRKPENSQRNHFLFFWRAFPLKKRSGNSHRTGSEEKLSTSGKRSVHKFPKSRKTS